MDSGREFSKVSRAVGKPKAIETDNSLEFGKSCEDFIMESSKIRLGWKMVGWFCGMLLLSAKCPETSWQMGKLLMSGDLENHLKAQSSRLALLLKIIPSLRKSSWGSTNLVRKSRWEYSSDLHRSRCDFGKEIFWLQTLRSWKFRRVRNPCSKTQCKENNYAEKWWTFHIPNHGWHSKIARKW